MRRIRRIHTGWTERQRLSFYYSLTTSARVRTMSENQAYAELSRRIKEYSLLGSCASVLGWDERTYMPRKGSAHRAEQMALLARMTHEMLTAPEIGGLLAEVEGSPLI